MREQGDVDSEQLGSSQFLLLEVGREIATARLYRIKAEAEGTKRVHEKGGNQQWVRRPLSLETSRRMEEEAKVWEVWRNVAWVRMALSCLMMPTVTEFFEKDEGRMHDVYYLKGGNNEFYAYKRQVDGRSNLG